MPQFDFFIWFSLSLGTIVTFQLLYYFILFYIIAPFSNLQKTLIKLYNIKQIQKELGDPSLFEHLVTVYFQKIKIKKVTEEATTTPVADSSKNLLKLQVTKKVASKKNIFIFRKTNIKIVNLKKNAILLKLKSAGRLANTASAILLTISKRKVHKHKKKGSSKKNSKNSKNSKKKKRYSKKSKKK